jgi:two-component system cell cycle sensor histidine kinase/response regulator CckA
MIQSDFGNAKILIVDDQEANLRLLERILTQGGYDHYRSLCDARQVVSTFLEQQPDLILLDLMMPHLNGVEVMEQLRPLAHETYLPILVLTADASPSARRSALAAGAKDFLTKPVDAVEVLLRIRNLLETRFLYQQTQRRADDHIRFQANLLDQANDAILVRDPQERILYWNRGAQLMYGWTAAEAVNRNALELFYRGSRSETDEARRAIEEHGAWEGELRQYTRDGREIIVATRWTLLRDDDDRPQARLIINTDITDKKKLETQLIQAQRMEAIGVLAGSVAHDFNNLLTVIIGFSEMALSGLAQEQPTHELIKQVRDAGNRAASLTRQLLAFSRKQVLVPVILDINELVGEAEKMLGRLIGEDIALTTMLDPTLGHVKADPAQFEQVLMNLVVNARDAMPTGGKLTIQTRNTEIDLQESRTEAGPHRSWVVLTVTDTGCGIDESTMARIFEPFFTTKEVGKGTGLGLSTVYGIVKQSGGFIEVDSNPGRGTSFQIFLPRLDIKTTKGRGSFAGIAVLPRGAGTVLLVEDEEGVRSLANIALRAAGYAVLEACNGEEAIDVLNRHGLPIDLLVTDLVMPKMSGRQLADHLAENGWAMKVVYMSGYADDMVVRHGVCEGMAFLQKPFTSASLARKVHQVLSPPVAIAPA